MSTLSFPGPVTVADPVTGGVYNFPFDHAGQAAIYAYFVIDGAEQALDLNTDYTVTPIDRGYGGGTITLLADPPAGASLVIDRLTPDIQGATLKTLERPIEHALDQLTQAVQDRARVLDRALKFPRTGGAYEADGRRIANMADPEAPSDAATMGYVDDQFAPYVDGFDTALAEAQAAQEAAEGARDDAADSAEEAGASEASAASSEAAAVSSETNASASEVAAAASEANAASSEANALASEVAARSSETAAAGSAGDAAASAGAASASQTAAGNSEAAALSSAQDAAGSASTAAAEADDAADSAAAALASEDNAESWAEKAEEEADRAQSIADGLGDPVAYTPQEKTPAEQAVARGNIGLGAVASDDVVPVERGGTGKATEEGLKELIDTLGLDAGSLTGTLDNERLPSGIDADTLDGMHASDLPYSFGEGWEWHDVTGSRARNTRYTNETGRVMMVSVTKDSNNQGGEFYIGDVIVGYFSGATNALNVSTIVPPGESYLVESSVIRWSELRWGA